MWSNGPRKEKGSRATANIDLARLPAPAPHRVDHLADRVDHELRLLLVYLVTAVRIGDVLYVRHELGELLLGCFCAASVM
jgi:hypothetical protein